jgi:hypothetical protein
MDPFRNLGPRPSPGEKITAIAGWADAARNQAVAYLLPQIWDRELRNAIFHSDYSIHGAEVRLPDLGQARSSEELAALSGKAAAYHDGVLGVRRYHLESYTEPKRVRAGSISRANPDEELWIIVRDGQGAIGLKDALTAEERAAGGGITCRYAKLYPAHQVIAVRRPACDCTWVTRYRRRARASGSCRCSCARAVAPRPA